MPPPLQSVPTLAQVFGPGVVYVPRRSPTLPGWSPPHPGDIDFLTGLHLGVAGGMPYVACAATVTPPALELQAEAGLPADVDLHVYRSVDEYQTLLSGLIGQGFRLACQRVHPEDEVPAHAAYPAPALVRRFNDKGEMDTLVRPDLLPPRRTIPTSELAPALDLLAAGRPIVLKAATGRPSGGGHGVWICHSFAEVDIARKALAVEERVVVEEHLDLAATVCVHGVVFPDGSSTLLGAAEEIVHRGRWLGNWHDAQGDQIPEPMLDVVRDIVANAASQGYRGITGVDLARLGNGTWLVLDLNFRVNGSTPGAWLRTAIAATRGASVLRGRSWRCPGGFDLLTRIVRGAVRRGTLIPLGFYDPDAAAMGGVARVGGLLLGNSREEIEEQDRRMMGEGLE